MSQEIISCVVQVHSFMNKWRSLVLKIKKKNTQSLPPTERFTVSSSPTNPIHCVICAEDNE